MRLRQAREDARAALMKSVRGGDLIGAVEEVGDGAVVRAYHSLAEAQCVFRIRKQQPLPSLSGQLQDCTITVQLGCALAVARPSVGTWYMPLPLETAAPAPSPKEVASGLLFHVFRSDSGLPKLLSWLGVRNVSGEVWASTDGVLWPKGIHGDGCGGTLPLL